MPPNSWQVGKELGMVEYDLDSQAFSSPAANMKRFAVCDEGQKLRVDVTLAQDGVSGDGVGGGKCTGGLERHPVKVKASGHGHEDAFEAGPAEATAVGLIREHGMVADTQEWTRQVEIVDAP